MCLHLRIVWELCQLVLYREEISCLIGDEFVEVDEAIEEDTYLGNITFQLRQVEMALRWSGFDHIVHLAQKVNE